MIRYAKGPAPAELGAFAATPGADWDGFHERQKVREALVRDQGSLCAYCQRRISADATTMKVEHWHPRSAPDGPAHEFEWSNLLGTCSGATMGERHCDTRRGDLPPNQQALYLHPVQGQGPDPREHLRYTHAGELVPASNDSRVTSDVNTTLNLNARVLRRGREAVLEKVVERLKKSDFSIAALKRLEAEHQVKAGGRAPECAEVVCYYVAKKLRAK